MVVLMLAAGGIYLLPENFMGAYANMYADVWAAVGGLFSLMLVPGFVVGYAACQSRILGAVWFIGFVVLGFISGISVWSVSYTHLALKKGHKNKKSCTKPCNSQKFFIYFLSAKAAKQQILKRAGGAEQKPLAVIFNNFKLPAVQKKMLSLFLCSVKKIVF